MTEQHRDHVHISFFSSTEALRRAIDDAKSTDKALRAAAIAAAWQMPRPPLRKRIRRAWHVLRTGRLI